MASELKVGRYSAGMKSRWRTTRSFGAEVSNHAGRWPHVTRWMRRTQGAKRSAERSQWRSVPQSRLRIAEPSSVSPSGAPAHCRRSASQAGSEPSTQKTTKSMSLFL